MKSIASCSRCGVPTLVYDALCAECLGDTLVRVAIVREYLVRTMDDPNFEWPYKHRPLS